MKSLLIALATATMLSGCVVAPYGYRTQPVYQPDVVIYPQVESAYIWDPLRAQFFFSIGGNRRYMDRGWSYRNYGPPGIHYHRR